MEARLQTQLAALAGMLRRRRLWLELTYCWGVVAVAEIVLLWIQGFERRNSDFAWGWIAMLGLTAAVFAWRRYRLHPADPGAAVGALERRHPELRHLLSAAAEQEPDPELGRFRYLQLRVIEEALAHPSRARWAGSFERDLSRARAGHATALAGLLLAVCLAAYSASRREPVLSPWLAQALTVTPGDVQMERGTSLVISARFNRRPPAEATLAVVWASGKTRRIALERHLADPVFGTALPEVAESGIYRVEYNGKATRDYRISVFDYPALAQADALLRYPAYTGLTNRLTRDTHRVSAVTGSRLTYTFQLNKPVARARWISGRQPPLLLSHTNAMAVLADFVLTNSARYRLELTDDDGRTNKFPVDFVLQALPDRRPELKLDFPRGDQRVSPLQELRLQGEAVDDFGLLHYGVGYALAGEEPKFIELGGPAPATARRRFDYLIPLEQLGAQVDQVISYFVWADDYGPDGRSRRTVSDVYFAEVRPFDEIFRRDDSGMGAGGGQGQSDHPAVRLSGMQKQIAIATWKLEQENGNPNSASP